MRKNKMLVTIFLVVFLDLLGLTIALPVITPLFIEHSFGLFDIDLPYKLRTLYLGAIVALYPIMQLFGAPLLGRWSDKVGRKKALIVSLGGTFLGHAMFALGVVLHHVPLLYIARAVDGFTGGNISVVQSIIADVSEPEEKVKNFGIVGIAVGMGLIFGPALGGVLSDATIFPWFGPALPFIAAGLLAVTNMWFVKKHIRETLQTKISKDLTPRLSMWHSLKVVFSNRTIRSLYLTTFLFMAGFTFFTQFFQVFAIDRFELSQRNIGFVFAMVGFFVAFTQGVVVRYIPKTWKGYNVPIATLLLLGLVFILLADATYMWHVLILLVPIAFGIGMSMPYVKALLSNATDETMQGEVLGIEQSLNALAQAIPPLIAGVIAGIEPSLPMIAAGLVIFIAWASYLRARKMYMKRYVHTRD